MAKYAPHPNLFLYRESFARTKFRIPKESFVILRRTVPSTVATSTTSIQAYDDVRSTTLTHAPFNASQQPVQDHRSTGPDSTLPIDSCESPVASPMQVHFAEASKLAPIVPSDIQPKVEFTMSNDLNLDIMFNEWETKPVKAMTLAMMTGDAQDDILHSHNESLEMSHLDTSSDLATSTSDFLPPRVENRITAWLQDLVEQPQTVVEYHEHGSHPSLMECFQED